MPQKAPQQAGRVSLYFIRVTLKRLQANVTFHFKNLNHGFVTIFKIGVWEAHGGEGMDNCGIFSETCPVERLHL